MAENWQAIAQEVAEAIGDVGFTATLVRTGVSIPDPDKPWETIPGATVSYPIRVVSSSFGFDEVDGTVIQSRDRKLMVEAGLIIPQPSDRIVIDGVSHEIVMIMPTDPGNVAVLYEIQSRA